MFNRKPEPRETEQLAAAMKRLPVVKAPDAIWNSIEASLDRQGRDSQALPERSQPRHWHWWAFAATAAALAVIAFGIYQRATPKVRWDVVRTTGTQEHKESVSAGDWLETDAKSTAAMRVGGIGTVQISPGTRLRIVTTKPNEHRLSLQHGEISASIIAPPKLFFVETKSATAVDLGCQYTMKVDDEGNGLLRVTLGMVSFDRQGRESLVPSGARCRTHAYTGPGTPVFEDAPATLKAALDVFDFESGGADSLRTILEQSRVKDTLTLWHLLSRVNPADRPLVYDRIVSFAPPPAGVTRAKALALDHETLRLWKNELIWTW